MQLGNKHKKAPWFVRRFFNISIRLIDVYACVRVLYLSPGEISNGIKRDFNQIDPMTENSLTENDWDKSALCTTRGSTHLVNPGIKADHGYQYFRIKQQYRDTHQ